jgi:hypothetical protein
VRGFAPLGSIQPYFRWDALTPYERSLLLLPILASALALLTFEVLAHMKSGARQRVYTFQTTISREADMYLRAVTVGHLYRSQFNVAAAMLAFEWFILVLMGPPLANAQSPELFLAIVVISAFLLRFVNRRLTNVSSG